MSCSISDLVAPKVAQRVPALEETIQYVEISSIDNANKRISSATTLTGRAAPTRARQVLRAGDVLVSMTRPNLNAVAMVPPALDGAIGSTGFDVLRAGPAVAPAWLYYRVQSQAFIGDMCRRLQGVVYPAVRPADVRAHLLPVPDLPEQLRRVAVIESQFSRLDAVVASLTRAMANVANARASVLKAAVEGRVVPTEASIARAEGRAYETGALLLGRVLAQRRTAWATAGCRGGYKEPLVPEPPEAATLPEGWCWATPGQLASGARYDLAIGPFGSNLKVTDYRDSGVPLVFVRNVRAEQYVGLDDRFVSTEKASELAPHRVRGGDIVITKMGEPPGDAAVYPVGAPDAVITADVIKWTAAAPVLGRYLMYATRSRLVRSQIVDATRGVAQKKISLERFLRVAYPLPPLNEQARIVAEVDRRLSVLDALDAIIVSGLARSARLRQSILKCAFEGRLVSPAAASGASGTRSDGHVEVAR